MDTKEIKIKDSGIWAIALLILIGSLIISDSLDKITSSIVKNTAALSQQVVACSIN